MTRAKDMARPMVQRLVAAVSRDRVVGERLPDALEAARALRRGGYRVALAYWNRTGEPASDIAARYRETASTVPDLGEGAYLSMKAPAFASDAGAFGEFLALAQSLGAQLHFDSAGIDAADDIFTLLEMCSPASDSVGCTLPGRWMRSLEDAKALRDADRPIRVVKGEWDDPSAPGVDPSRGFLDVIARLAGREAPVRVATHDSDLAARAIAMLRLGGTPCHAEMLYGFPVRGLVPRLVALDVPIRVYVPFGYGWVPYCLDYVRQRPSFLWWLLRDSLGGSYPRSFPVLSR
jgi:proline dehydrogenase